MEVLEQQSMAKGLRQQVMEAQADCHAMRVERNRLQTRRAQPAAKPWHHDSSAPLPRGTSRGSCAVDRSSCAVDRTAEPPAHHPLKTGGSANDLIDRPSSMPGDLARSRDLAEDLGQRIVLGSDLKPLPKTLSYAGLEPKQLQKLDFERYAPASRLAKSAPGSPHGAPNSPTGSSSGLAPLPPVQPQRSTHPSASAGALHKGSRHGQKPPRSRGSSHLEPEWPRKAPEGGTRTIPSNPEGVWDELCQVLRDL